LPRTRRAERAGARRLRRLLHARARLQRPGARGRPRPADRRPGRDERPGRADLPAGARAVRGRGRAAAPHEADRRPHRHPPPPVRTTGVTMPQVAGTRIVLNPTPPTHFGAGAVDTVAGVVNGTGGQAAVVVTDQGLAATPVVASVVGVLTAGGIPVTVFSGVHANPTIGDVAVGGGSSVDAAKGIAVAAVNPERGRDLDYRRTFSAPALPLVAVPTTAGTGTETNAFGVITDPVTRRKFYVGSATALPAAAILDPQLTASLPPGATAA